MKLRTRLTITYTLLITAITFCMVLFFRQYSVKIMEERAEEDLQVLAENMSHQLDEIVRPMEFISEFLLSDGKTLSAINTISNAESSALTPNYVMLAKMDLKSSLITYCIDENFHQVTFFSENGDFLSSNVRLNTISDGYANPAMLQGISRVDQNLGKPVLMGPYADPWARGEPEKVFSLIRAVQGGATSCYLEVQKTAEILDNIFALDSSSYIQVAAMDSMGNMLFSQLTKEQNQWLNADFQKNDSFKNGKILNLQDGSIIAMHYSDYTGVYTFAVQNKEGLKEMVSYITNMTFFAFLLVLIVSSVFVYVASKRLTEPIRKLTGRMEKTNLENMEELENTEYDVEPKQSNDEIVMLNYSYNHLMQRLNQAMQREKRLSTLQVQAEFDALQAQVNPHFLYNVLNVISHRGVVNGDETICEICDHLAAMLRFSTGTAQRIVTIREELEYVSHYLYLLKTRYRDKLQCEIDIEESIQDELIPKIVLQQIVENSIAHGFYDTAGEMRIEIKGWKEDGYWYIRVKDNGSGFEPSALAFLIQKRDEICKQAARGEWRGEMDIGGMGLLNTYMRMLLLFEWDFIFELSNAEKGEHGAIVLIGAKIQKELSL